MFFKRKIRQGAGIDDISVVSDNIHGLSDFIGGFGRIAENEQAVIPYSCPVRIRKNIKPSLGVDALVHELHDSERFALIAPHKDSCARIIEIFEHLGRVAVLKPCKGIIIYF